MSLEKKRVYLSPPDVGHLERELLLDAFDSNWIAPLGPHVDAFEAELSQYLDVPYVVALSSGTAALHLALLELGVGRGDLVLVSTLTFSATANAVRYVGAEPVFIDSTESSWNIDPGLLEEALSELKAAGKPVRAVIAVDLYGQCADYDQIEAVCRRFGVPLLEDAAEALGTTYRDKRAGAFGTAAVFSFNGNKIITTSGGGALVSHDRRIIDRARHLATQAREQAPHYEHVEVGYNYRMSNLLAAVGRGQLRGLESKIDARRANYAAYHDALAGLDGLEFMPEADYGRPTRWLTCLTVDAARFGCDRDQLRVSLEAENIEARPVWKPMHLQPAYRDCRVFERGVSNRLFADGLCLPSGSNLAAEDRQRVIEIISGQHRRDGHGSRRASTVSN